VTTVDKGVCDADGVIWKHIGNTPTEFTLGLDVSLAIVYSIVIDIYITQNRMHDLLQKLLTLSQI
jgi:hypothetical protein